MSSIFDICESMLTPVTFESACDAWVESVDW
jgi:hypothetical protein